MRRRRLLIFALLICPACFTLFPQPEAPQAQEKASAKVASPLRRAAALPSPPTPGDVQVLIGGPASVGVGRLTRFEVDIGKLDYTGFAFQWRLAGGTAEDYEVTDGGRLVYFASPTPGTYTLLLAVARNGEAGQAPQLRLYEKQFDVTDGRIPVPVPPEKPPVIPPESPGAPPEPPPAPADLTTLGRAARDATLHVEGGNVKREAQTIAQAYYSMAETDASAFKSAQDFVDRSKTAVEYAFAVVGGEPRYKAWEPWRVALKEALTVEAKAGRLGATVPAHKIAWKQIALGLEAASR